MTLSRFTITPSTSSRFRTVRQETETEMAEREYKDSEGNVVTLDKLVRIEPEWAADIIRWYEGKLDRYCSALERIIEAWDGDSESMHNDPAVIAREALSDE